MNRYFFLFIISLLTLSGCQKDNSVNNSLDKSKVNIIHAAIADSVDTRVSLDGVSVKWSVGDNIKLFAIDDNNKFTHCYIYKIVDTSISSNGKSADFTGELLATNSKYIAFYGSDVELVGDNIHFKTEPITQIGTSFENITKSLKLSSGVITSDSEANLSLKFNHMNSIIEFNLKLASDNEGEYQVSEIIFKSTAEPFSLAFQMNANNVVTTDNPLNYNKVIVESAPMLNKETPFKVQMINYWNPNTYLDYTDTDFVVTIKTTDGKNIEIVRPARTLTPGVIYSVDAQIEKQNITLSEDSRSVGSSSGLVELLVYSNTDWTVGELPEWLTVDSSQGTGNSSVKVTYQENPYAIERSAKIKFTVGSETKEFELTQQAAQPTLELDKTSHSAAAKEESFKVNITTNGRWHTETSSDWVTITHDKGEEGGEVTITCSENLSAATRLGYIWFKTENGEVKKEFSIRQEGQYILTVSSSELVFMGDAATKVISLESNYSWQVTSDSKWLSVSTPSRREGLYDIDIKVLANPGNIIREGEIVFTTGTETKVVTKTVKVTQLVKPTLVIAQETLFAPFRTTAYDVNVESNNKWEVISDQKWCSVSPLTSEGNGMLTISLELNSEYKSRSANITVIAGTEEEGYVTRTIIVTQNANSDFSLDDWDDNGDHGGSAQ